MSNFKRLAITLVILLFCTAFPAKAKEQIYSFHSDINVNPDGSLAITETISLRHEGRRIKRGIYRDLSQKKGERYKILYVLRNNAPEPWFTETKDGYFRLNTGNDAPLPAPADSTYEISYLMYDALRPIKGENLNELYLNITGAWDFTIKEAAASVRYPEGTKIVRQYGYQTNLANRKYAPGTDFVFKNLRPGDEATIAQAFAKGTVNIPLPQTIAILLAALIATLIYYLIAWYLYGKDPASRAIVPDWEIPHNLTPLECAYINNNGAEPQNAFFLHILHIITQKAVTVNMREQKGIFSKKTSYELITNQNAAPSDLETTLYLKKHKRCLSLDGSANNGVAAYNAEVQNAVSQKLEGVFYRRRLIIAIIGAMLFPVAHAFINRDLYLLAIIIGWMLPALLSPHKSAKIIALLCIVIIVASFSSSLLLLAMLIAWLALVIIFYRLMFQPTALGLRQKEKIEGLKMFLTAITANNIEIAAPKDKNGLSMQKRLTPEDMDALFPYAVALNLEDKWAKKYEAVFGAAAYAAAVNNSFYCHQDFCHNFASTCSASATPLASSGSGSRGGGFAGGGFGGGRGGGR